MVYNHDTVDGCEIRITSWKRWLIPLFPGNHPFGSAGLVGCGHGLMTECGQILRFGSPGFQVWPLWAWRAWLGEWTCPWGAMRGGRNIIIIITKVIKVIKVIKIMRGQIWSIHIWYWYLLHLPTSIGCWIAVFFPKGDSLREPRYGLDDDLRLDSYGTPKTSALGHCWALP